MTHQKNFKHFNFDEHTGALPFHLTNDAFFHFLLQENENILRMLLCAILHILDSDILSLTILNPIAYGSVITAKMLILDISLHMNDNTYINLEMQVTDYHNWVERDLTYASHNLNQLSKGEYYTALQPVIQISFLDYTLFPNYPEFFATYKILNTKNYNIFTDKLCFHVIDLSKIELATVEDKAHGIDHWALMFKAKTWEELKMLANKDSIFENVAQNVKQFSSDQWFGKVIDAREDEIRNKNDFLKYYEHTIASQNNRIAELEKQLKELRKQ